MPHKYTRLTRDGHPRPQNSHPQPGESNGRAKITEADVRQIRQRWKHGEKQRIIGADYGLSQGAVNQIVSRKKWKHVA